MRPAPLPTPARVIGWIWLAAGAFTVPASLVLLIAPPSGPPPDPGLEGVDVFFRHIKAVAAGQLVFGLLTALGAAAFLRGKAAGRLALALSSLLLGLFLVAWFVLWARSVHHMVAERGFPAGPPPIFAKGFAFVMIAAGAGMHLGFGIFLGMWVRYMYGPKLASVFGTKPPPPEPARS